MRIGIDAQQVAALIEEGNVAEAARIYQSADPDPDATRALFGTLNTAESAALVGALTERSKVDEILRWLPYEQTGAILSVLDPVVAARLLASLRSDDRTDLLAEVVDEESRAAIQAALPAEAQASTARLLEYDPDTAGGLMETEYLSFPAETTVTQAIANLRANQERYAAIGVQYVYVLDAKRRLLGVVPIRDLMLGSEGATVGSLIRRKPAIILDTAGMRELALAFDEYPFVGLPVVDQSGAMLGVVSRADATEAEHEEAEETYRVSQGIVGGEELRSMPVTLRLRRRTAWLGVNLILCLGGAAVIAMHQKTLSSAIVVAAVLPVISATSGNAAMQAAAVSIRELTLGIIDPGAWRRVLVHEISMAMLMALPLGFAVAFLSKVWGASWAIGAAVGGAMAMNTLAAIGIGAVCPLVLRRLKVDPALASGPICTTLADIAGFAMTLTLVAMTL